MSNVIELKNRAMTRREVAEGLADRFGADIDLPREQIVRIVEYVLAKFPELTVRISLPDSALTVEVEANLQRQLSKLSNQLTGIAIGLALARPEDLAGREPN